MDLHNKYKDFREPDFINDPYFQEWIIRPDEETNGFWKSFKALYPEKANTVDRARKMLISISFDEKWPAEEKVNESLKNALAQINTPVVSLGKEIAGRSSYRRWWTAAAILLLIASAGYYFLVSNSKHAEKQERQGIAKLDIAPGGDKAVLTLANGKKVVLDTAANGDLEKQGNVRIIKLNGQLAYNKEAQPANEVLYNTISTPRGGQYQLILTDGTKVWLNAASSLRFPTTFPGARREVILSGEGYFEVAPNHAQPFSVSLIDGTQVEVLGTHFNVMAYTDEHAIKTTLLEGAVKVTKQVSTQLLSPGQQAQVNPDGKIVLVKNADTDEAVAWKNGLFQFTGADVATVMRQVGRWYDLNVHLQGNLSGVHLSGKVSRNLKLSQVIAILEESGIEIKLEGKEITASPTP